MTPAESLAVLTDLVAALPYRPDTRSSAEVARDEWLEGLAEARAEERLLPVSARESDRQADLYFGGAA